MFSAATLFLFGSWYCYTSTFDTATVGLMSVNILQGDRPLFFYGQPYFGALEAYLGAFFLSIFGFSEFVVSFAPITFTLGWILFTASLFTRIHNRTAGLVAAACIAFPGYYVFWYSIATYGGYSAMLCIGTALLWLSLKIFQDNPRHFSLVWHGVCLGVLMGLGIWIHALTFPYIIIATAILGVFALKERFRVDILLSFGLTVLIALIGFLPFYFETGTLFGGISEPVQMSKAVVLQAISNLFTVNIFELVVWNFTHTFESSIIGKVVEYGTFSVLVVVSLLACFALVSARKRLFTKVNYLVPLSYCLLFLTMYVQHHMATIKAPRYAIGFWCMLLCMLWTLAVAGQTKRIFKRISLALFCLWIGYQVSGTVLFIVGSHAGARAEQKVSRDLVEAARKNKLKSVVIYGDHVFGLKGQKFSMLSQNEIAFSHIDLERYQGNAQFAETDLHRGYLTNTVGKSALENTLQQLRTKYTVEKVHDYFLFSNVQLSPQFVMQAIPSDEINFFSPDGEKTGRWEDQLGNRSQDFDTGVQMIDGETISFDTGRLRTLCGLWLFTSQDPHGAYWKGFGRYEVSVSPDNISYEKVYSSLPRTGNAFYAGPNIYIGGRLGRGDVCFTPVLARYVKIRFVEKSPHPITELFVFQTNGVLRQDPSDDIENLVRIIVQQDLDFVLADRWVSARLREVFKGGRKDDIALPRRSSRYKNTSLRYFVRPVQGQAVVCDAAVADECEKALTREYGESVISHRYDVHSYSIFTLADIDIKNALQKRSALLWNGHVPLQTKDMTLMAPWFNTMGLPVWRADFTKTKGVYHDSWTNGEGMFYNLDYRIDHEKDQELALYTHGWRPGNNSIGLQLKVVANDNISLQLKEKRQDVYIFSLPANLDRLDRVEVRSSTFVPSKKDARSLGIDIKRIEIQ